MNENGGLLDFDSLGQLSATEQRIIDAAVRNFVHYGIRKTTLADIAKEAEISRQTLYASFGTKDDLIVAAILHFAKGNILTFRGRLTSCKTLAEQLDAYFASTIIRSFKTLQSSDDAEDLISGHNKAGKAAIEQTRLWHRSIIADLLIPHAIAIGRTGQTPAELAHWFVSSAMAMKYEAHSRDALDRLLHSLKVSVLLAADQPL